MCHSISYARRQLQALVRQRPSALLLLQPRGSRDANLSFVLERPSQRCEVQLTVRVEKACRSGISARSTDHVQLRIGSSQGWVLIWEKKDFVRCPDRPSASRNRVMGPHLDDAVPPLFDIEVLGAES